MTLGVVPSTGVGSCDAKEPVCGTQARRAPPHYQELARMRQENFVRAGAVFGVTDFGTGLHQQGEPGRPSHVRDLGAVVDGQCLELLASLVDGTELGLGQSQSSTE